MRKKIEFSKEYYLQIITNTNLKRLFGLNLITSEFQFNDLRFDGLAYDEKTKSFVIIEYKNKIDFNVLDQGKTYYDLLQQNREEYIARYNEEFDANLKEADFDFEKTKVIIISPQFAKDQIEKSKNPEYPFELYKAALYKCDEENGCIAYSQVNGDFSKYLKIRLDSLKITEEMLLKGKSPEMVELYNKLKNRVLDEFDDVAVRYMVDQFSFRADDNLVSVVVFLKSSFNIFLYGENLDACDNTEDICEKSTGGNANYKFNCKTDEDIDCFMDLFRQVYEQKV